MSEHPAPPSTSRDPLLLGLLIAAAIYVFWDVTRAFAQADEFWYAEVVRGLLSGDLLTHRLGPRPDFTKPPVYFWLSLPFARVMPFEPAMRVVPGLSFLAVIGLIYRLNLKATGRVAARVAAVAFLLCYDQLHLHGFRSGVIEGLLALELTVALWLNMRLRRDPGSIRWIGLVLGLTLMTKTAFVVFPVALTALNLWIQRGRLDLQRRHLLQAAGLGALTVVPWFVATCSVNGVEVLRKMFLEDVFQRALKHQIAAEQGLSFGRDEVLYGLRHLLTYGQPWTLLIPPALWRVWRERGAALSSETLLQRLAAAWLLGVLGVFTLSRGVWGWYLQSLYVPAAILIGGLFSELLARDPQAESDRGLQAAVAGLAVAALAISPLPYGYNPYVESAAIAPLDDLLWQRTALAGALALLFVSATRRGARLGKLVAVAVPLTVGFGAYTWWYESGGAHDTTLALMAAPTLAALWLLDGTSQRRAPQACLGALIVLGVGYLAAPLRFARLPNQRTELRWLQGLERDGPLREPVERPGSFYSWIVLYHARASDYSITYETERQTIRVAPKGN